jgi:plasmid stabilization system protein ParE
VAKNYRLTTKAGDDIAGIVRYIADNNPAAARKVRAAIMEAFPKLGENPYLGHKREDLTMKPVRFWLVAKNYLVVYDPAPRPVAILHIFPADRDVAFLLAQSFR